MGQHGKPTGHYTNSAKQVRQRRTNIASFHLCEVSNTVKLRKTENRMVVAWGRGEGEMCVAIQHV